MSLLLGVLWPNAGHFMVLQDMSGRIQAYAAKTIQKELKARYQGLDIGDIIGVTGVLARSGKGDLYVDIQSYQLLTKALRPLPEKFHGLTDQEMRYRQRYLDLITNESTRHTFEIRSKVITGIRQFLEARQFTEVETPMMQAIPGGASAYFALIQCA